MEIAAPKHKCPNCQEIYTPIRHANGQLKLYCSNKCRAAFHKSTKRTCIVCGVVFKNTLPDTKIIDNVECHVCSKCRSIAGATAKEVMKNARERAYYSYGLNIPLQHFHLPDIRSGSFMAEEELKDVNRIRAGLLRIKDIEGLVARWCKVKRDPKFEGEPSKITLDKPN